MSKTELLQSALAEYFAPWIHELALTVESCDEDSMTLRLPQNAKLSRVGGMLCGQAMMAAADTAMALALVNHFGEFKPCTTVQMNASFLKPLSNQDALIQARVLRAGKSLAFGDIDIRARPTAKPRAARPPPMPCSKDRLAGSLK